MTLPSEILKVTRDGLRGAAGEQARGAALERKSAEIFLSGTLQHSVPIPIGCRCCAS